MIAHCTRRIVGAFSLLSAVACSSAGRDATGPGGSDLAVTLTASASRITTPGDITLSALANNAGVQRVEFYQQVIGTDASPRKIAEDLAAPYEIKHSVVSPAENGDIAFTAKAYDASGHTATSSTVMVTIALIADNTPLQATVTPSHTRITTPGRINFSISANKAISRAELYSGATKVGELVSPATPYLLSVAVTQADNGTHAYAIKVYDFVGQVVESPQLTVEVDIRWDFIRTVGDISSTRDWFVATDATNSLYLTGATAAYNLVLIKHDAAGHEVWRRTFGGPDSEYPRSIGVDPTGRIFIAGNIYVSSSPTQGSCFLTLYDPAGNLVRTQLISGTSITTAVGCAAAVDASGNFYVLGLTAESTDGHGFVAKYAPDGAFLWTHKFGGQTFPSSEFPTDEPTGIAVDATGGVYVGGYTGNSFDGSPNRGQRDMFVLKLDADGNRLWSRQYGTAGVLTFAGQLAADPDGGVYISGQTDDPNQRFAHSDALLVRYGADGVPLWTQRLDGGAGDGAYAVAADRNGVYIGGETNVGDNAHEISEPRQGAFDVLFAKFTRQGEKVFVRLLGTPAIEFASGVAIGPNGDVYVAGGSVFDAPATLNHPLLARHRDAP